MKGSAGERLEWDAIQALSAMKNGSSLTSSPSGSEKASVPQLPSSGLLINTLHNEKLTKNNINNIINKPVLPSLQQQIFQPQFVPILSAQDISMYLHQQHQQHHQQQLLNLSPSFPTLPVLQFPSSSSSSLSSSLPLHHLHYDNAVVSNVIPQQLPQQQHQHQQHQHNNDCKHEYDNHHHQQHEHDHEHEHELDDGNNGNHPCNDSDNDNDNSNNGNQNLNGQSRLVGNCFGCGRSKSRVYKYLGVHSPICNACNQHWRRDEHKLKNCSRCVVLAGLNADLSLRGTSANERQERALRNAAAAAAAAACGLPFTPGSAAKKSKLAAMNMKMNNNNANEINISKSNSNRTLSAGSTEDNKAPISMDNHLLCVV